MNQDVIPFREFNESGEVRIYKSSFLPHWRQDGCTYFVTFRLADSLPSRLIREIDELKERWLKLQNIDAQTPNWHENLNQLSMQKQIEFRRHVAVAVESRLDQALGNCTLAKLENAEIVASALRHFHQDRVMCGDFVVMPNHVHVLLMPINGYELEDLLRSIKGFSSKRINELEGTSGTIWHKDSYDHVVRDFQQLEAFQKYIAANPRKANLSEGQFLLHQMRFQLET